MSIGENIKKRRLSANLTQAQLAEKTSLGQPYIAQLERGSRILNVMTGKAIAEALDCKLEDLMRENSGA